MVAVSEEEGRRGVGVSERREGRESRGGETGVRIEVGDGGGGGRGRRVVDDSFGDGAGCGSRDDSVETRFRVVDAGKLFELTWS